MNPANVFERLVALETEIETEKEFRKDVESRLRKIERALYIIGTVLGGLQFALKLIH